jgi:phosphonate transport system substrate-binding protein
MIRRRLLTGLGLAAALAAAGLGAASCSQKASQTSAAPKELTFSILSAENQASMEPLWQPLLDDMSAQVGVKVKPYFASNYTSLVEAMRFNQVQVGWFSASPALEAVNRANADVLGRVIDAGGDATYKSVLIVKKGSGITLDKVLACGKTYSFGLGDAQSTSGTLAPLAYLFAPKGIEPAACFKAVRSASHQANFFSVANGVLDVATNNTVGLLFARRENPAMADKVEVIWTSPPLPESSILARKDLDPAIKEKIRQFFLTYGTGTGPTADKQRAVLKGLAYGGFKPADNSYLDPVREMEAANTLAEARKSGDKARIDAAQAAFDKVRAAAAQKQAVNPDI